MLVHLFIITSSAPTYLLNGNEPIVNGNGDVDSSWKQFISPSSVSSATINEGIESLLSECFSECVSLKTVSLPLSLKSIDSAFTNTGLERIMIPKNVINITNIGAYDNKNLIDIMVDPLNTAYSAYKHCLYDKNFTTLLTGAVGRHSIIFHENLTTINAWSCATCFFDELFFPDKVKFIYESAFVDSRSSSLVIHFSENSQLELLQNGAFQMSKIKNFILPSNISILNSIFHASSIQNFSFHPNSNLKQVNANAFNSCDKLEYVYLPKSVNVISSAAFTGCTSLISITVEEGCKNYMTRNQNLFSADLSQLVFCTPTTKELIIPRGTSTISQSMLQSYEELTNVSFENGVSDYFEYEGGIIYSKGFISARYVIGSIENARIRDETTVIEARCFSGAKKLKKVTFGSNSNCTDLKEYSFYKCTNLTEFVFPPSLRIIQTYCLSETKLRKAVLPPTVTYIGSCSFYLNSPFQFNSTFCRCNSECSIASKAFIYDRFSSLMLPEGLLSIGERAFMGSSASSLEIPSTVASIGERAFEGFAGAKRVVFGRGSTLSLLSVGVFEGYSSLEEISLPGSVTAISESAFSKCNDLRRIVWMGEPRLERIEDRAFAECKSMESFDFPCTVVSIIPTAFYRCFGLMEFTVSGGCSECVYGVCNGSLVRGRSSLCVFPPGRSEGFVPGEIKGIEERAFYGCGILERLSFAGDSIQSIRENTFFECSSLESLVLPGSVLSIMDKAFESCVKLRTIEVSDGSRLREIGAATFSGCSSLERFAFLGSSVLESVGAVTFSGSKLSSFVFPQSVRSVGPSAFSNCARLARLVFEGGCPGLRSLEESCFSLCSRLREVGLPVAIEVIGERAFAGCDLDEVVIPERARIIGERAFASNPHMKRIFYCGNGIFRDVTVFEGSGSPFVFALANYTEVALFGIECQRVMRRCMVLPCAGFSIGVGGRGLSVEMSLMVILISNFRAPKGPCRYFTHLPFPSARAKPEPVITGRRPVIEYLCILRFKNILIN